MFVNYEKHPIWIELFALTQHCSQGYQTRCFCQFYILDNILLTKDLIPKIADFGLSIQFESFDFSKSKCGTFLYMAPEILLNKLYSKVLTNYIKPVDVWATGIIMY